MTRIAQRAEELGFHSLWTFQRLLVPPGDWPQAYHSVHDPVVPLAFVASVTNRIRLGVAVFNMPFLSPVLLAKQLSSLDVVSEGRVDVGLGNGWSEAEFAAVGASMHGRGRRADEYIARLKALWSGDTPEFTFAPRPVQQPHPPILLGGGSPAALRRAGRLCDGWVSGSQASVDKLGAAVETVKHAAREAGRDPEALRFVCRAPKVKTREDLERIQAQGMTETFVDLNFDPEIGSPAADPVRAMRIAEERLEALAP